MTEKIIREKRLEYMRERNTILKDVYSNILEKALKFSVDRRNSVEENIDEALFLEYKQLNDTISACKQGELYEISTKQRAEIEQYLPKMLSIEEIISYIKDNHSDIEKALKALNGIIQKELKGKANGGDIARAISLYIKG